MALMSVWFRSAWQLNSVLTWFCKVPQWIITHHPAIVGQEVTRFVRLVHEQKVLFQRRLLKWEREIPARIQILYFIN